MQKNNGNQSTKITRRKAVSSVTSRRNLKRPSLKDKDEAVSVNISSSTLSQAPMQAQTQMQTQARTQAQVQTQAQQQVSTLDIDKVNKMVRARIEQTQRVRQQSQRQSAKIIKQQEIAKAIAQASREQKETKKSMKNDTKFHFGWKRVLLAFACAVASVFAIVYFVNLNAPDITLKVAAMQTGIEASYPSYVPREYTLSDITSENGRVTLHFTNNTSEDSYTLIEEKSSWDSNALLSNFVKKNYGDAYDTVKENGLTLYIFGSNASWVNGGVFYRLECASNSLTKKQIRAIAVSL